jgi:SAM-dependent methyltransferase
MLCAMTDGPFLAPFDLIGEAYDESFTDRTAQLDAGAWIIEALPRGARVLDLGCGSGLPTAMQLDEAGLDVVGTDESEVMLRLARRRAPHSRFLCRDMRDLSDLGDFDAVVSFFSLIMLPKADIVALLNDLQGILRGPKLLAISTVYGNFDDFPIMFLGVPAKVTAWPTDELVEVVQDAGFTIEQTDEVEAEAEPGRMERQIYIRARSNR